VGFGEVLIVVVALAYFVASYQRKRSGAAPRRVVCSAPLYSLECVEEEFCELRLCRILRSSAWRGSRKLEG
jgi:hypothetical protein